LELLGGFDPPMSAAPQPTSVAIKRACAPGRPVRTEMKPVKKNPESFDSGLELLGGFEPPTSSLPSAVGYAPSGEMLLSIEILAFCNVLNLETTSGCMICTASLMHFHHTPKATQKQGKLHQLSNNSHSKSKQD